jgi:hypothetical protein
LFATKKIEKDTGGVVPAACHVSGGAMIHYKGVAGY